MPANHRSTAPTQPTAPNAQPTAEERDERLLAHVSLKAMLYAAAVGGVLAASLCLVGRADATTPAPPNAVGAQSSSSAYGAASTGADPVSPSPSVSSSGAVKSSSGTVSSPAGTFTASGITVRAGAGIAESRVASLTVAGETFGPISTTCRDGVTKVAHNGKEASAKNLSVSYGTGGGPKAVGITVTISGAGDQDAQTITAAVANCGKGNPPGGDTDPAPNPDDQPGNTPKSDESASEDSTTNEQAPAPRLHTHHHPVTG